MASGHGGWWQEGGAGAGGQELAARELYTTAGYARASAGEFLGPGGGGGAGRPGGRQRKRWG